MQMGHNCVLQIPDSNKWYIIYHRFTKPEGITMGDAAGYNREVCIDVLQFDDDGNILQVRPTVEGFGSEVKGEAFKDRRCVEIYIYCFVYIFNNEPAFCTSRYNL